MELFFQFFLLCIGLGLLWRVGELAIKHAIGFSDIFGITRFTIGFFIFAISTGLPEISSAVISSLKGVPELSAGDLLGSTFVNLSLILGLVAFFSKNIEIDSSLHKKLLWSAVLILMIFVGLVFTADHKFFSGVLLIAIYIGSFLLFRSKKRQKEAKAEIEKIKKEEILAEKKPFISAKVDITVKLTISLMLLLLSSWLTVHAAINIATMLGMSLSIIGASVIAVGTGLPEISLEMHAVRKKEYSLALGDIFGSSLLNVSFVLGMLILMNKKVDLSIVKSILPFIVVGVGWALSRICPQKPLRRLDSYIFLALFAIYITFLALLQNGPLGL